MTSASGMAHQAGKLDREAVRRREQPPKEPWRSRLQPARIWPRAASGRTRSHTILVVARIGAERIAPGTPHSQNQNTKEKITRTGLSVNRLARSIGVTVSPSITWMAP